MSIPLRVLVLEDRPADAELMVHELHRAGFEPDWRRVDNEADYLASLEPAPDVILADYSLPQWDASRALYVLHESGLDIPFIMVSGSIGEDVAVECMKQGAADYLLKDRMTRLGPAVVKALADKRLREEKSSAEEELRHLKEFNENIVQTMTEGVTILDIEGVMTFVNPTAAAIMGYTQEELVGQHWTAFISPDQRIQYHSAFERRRQGEAERYEADLNRKDGTRRTVLVSASPRFENERFVGILSVFTDITERKRISDAERSQRILAETLAETASILISTLDFNVVLDRILQSVGRVVPHDSASIMLFNDNQVRVAAWRGYNVEAHALLENSTLPSEAFPFINDLLGSHAPLLVPDTRADPAWANLESRLWSRSLIAIPLQANGQVIGFLDLDSQTPGFFTLDHVQRLQAFADQASIAIEHAQLYEEIRHHADELEQRVMERTAQLDHAKDRMEAILNSSSDVIILCRLDGTIDQANPAFDRTFECQPEEVLFRRLANLVAPPQAPSLELAFEMVIKTRRPQRLEITALCKEDATFDMDMVLSPIVEQDGQLSGVICSLRDITERKRMEVWLRQMLQREMELNELKSRYVSMAAHDLRNPLAAIQTAVNFIERYSGHLTEERKQAKYHEIYHSIKTMVELLDDTLTIGQVESGKLKFEPKPLDLIALCFELAAEAQQATGAMQRVQFAHQDIPDMVCMDAKLLRHILGNLLSNAIKYSPADSAVTFEAQGGPGTITFCVQDKGIGIPRSERARMFETFYRADNVGTTPGTGLGLAIVKQSVDLHGGTITFESEENVGTTFTAVIPCDCGKTGDPDRQAE